VGAEAGAEAGAAVEAGAGTEAGAAAGTGAGPGANAVGASAGAATATQGGSRGGAVDGLVLALRAARDEVVDAAIAGELAPGPRAVVGAGRAALTTAAGCERILRAATASAAAVAAGAGAGAGGDESEAALKAAAGAMAWLNALAAASTAEGKPGNRAGGSGGGDAVGPYKLHSLKAPGFNPCAYTVKTWFQSFQMQLLPLHRGFRAHRRGGAPRARRRLRRFLRAHGR
jgi:hypothetical protein